MKNIFQVTFGVMLAMASLAPSACETYGRAGAYVQKIFIGYLGRPATPAAMQYYADYLSVDMEQGKLILFDDLYYSEEAQSLYSTSSLSDQIDQFYQFLFARMPLLSGRDYWIQQINNGYFTIPASAAYIADSASGSDMAVLDAKQVAATKLTCAIGGDTGKLSAFQANLDSARSSLANVWTAEDAASFNGDSELAAITGEEGGGSTDTSLAPFSVASRTLYQIEYSENDPYSVYQPGCGYTPPGQVVYPCRCWAVCENFQMEFQLTPSQRAEGASSITTATFPFYDGWRSIDFYYDQLGTLRQLGSWDARFQQFDYLSSMWGAPFIPAPSDSSATGSYAVGIGVRGAVYALKDENGSLLDLGMTTTQVDAFPEPIEVRIFELRTEIEWGEGNTDYRAGTKASVVQRTAWSEEHGIVWIEKDIDLFEKYVTGDFARPVEIHESWSMIGAPQR